MVFAVVNASVDCLAFLASSISFVYREGKLALALATSTCSIIASVSSCIDFIKSALFFTLSEASFAPSQAAFLRPRSVIEAPMTTPNAVKARPSGVTPIANIAALTAAKPPERAIAALPAAYMAEIPAPSFARVINPAIAAKVFTTCSPLSTINVKAVAIAFATEGNMSSIVFNDLAIFSLNFVS